MRGRITWACSLGIHSLKPIVRAWRPGPLPDGCRGLIRVRPGARVCFHMGDRCRKCGHETVSERLVNGSLLSRAIETKA